MLCLELELNKTRQLTCFQRITHSHRSFMCCDYYNWFIFTIHPEGDMNVWIAFCGNPLNRWRQRHSTQNNRCELHSGDRRKVKGLKSVQFILWECLTTIHPIIAENFQRWIPYGNNSLPALHVRTCGNAVKQGENPDWFPLLRWNWRIQLGWLL